MSTVPTDKTKPANAPAAPHARASLEERARRLGVDLDDPEALQRMAKRAHELQAVVSRTDPNMFCSFVLRDEQTQRRIKQAPMHREWHEAMNKHDRLVMWSHIEGGKTTQLSIGRTLWELGHDPTLRVCVVSNTADLAKKMTRFIGQYIEKSPELHEVFPHLLPTDDPNLTWRAQSLTVRRPGMGGKDPSVQACGVHGNVIGSRIDLLILDDVLDHENTHTPGPRDDVYRWIKSSLFSRLTDRARVWIVGNAWHPDDAMHRLEKEEAFYALRFPVISPTGVVTWPERWSLQRIEKARQDLGPLEYARQLLCQARDDTSARFKKEWVDECLARGEGLGYCESREDMLRETGRGELTEEELLAADTVERLRDGIVFEGGVVTGVDLAVQRHDAADETVLFTIYVHPNGDRQVLNIEAGKWTGPDIIKAIRSVHARFGGMVVVENNASQDYIVQFLRNESAVPVVPFTTGKNKAHPEFGVEGLATEMANGKWLIPNKGGTRHKQVDQWITELLFYDPREHTGDRVMASWFAREGARRFYDNAGGNGEVDVRLF